MGEDHPAGAWVQIQTPPLTSSEALGKVLGSLLQLLSPEPPHGILVGTAWAT